MAKIILHVVEAAGGVERYLISLLTKLQGYAEYKHVLACSTTYDVKKYNGLVSAIEIIPSMHNVISLTDDVTAIREVRHVIKKYKPDIVYCHSSKAGAIGRIADLGVSNKLLYNAHGWSFNIKDASQKRLMAYELIERFLAPFADKIICISEYEKQSALAHRIAKEEKLIVIDNGIDFEVFTDISPKNRRELRIPEQAFVVGTIGRLAPQKAPDVFIEMASQIKKHIPNAFFLMVGDDIGDGKMRSEVESKIKSSGLQESFCITGWVDNPLDYLGLFDVATLLSRWEGFGLVLPEYMYMGKPIVATKADAIPYVVSDAGLLVNIDDYKAAAESVIKLYEDQELRNRLIEIGKERVKLFNVQRTADEHKRVFDML